MNKTVKNAFLEVLCEGKKETPPYLLQLIYDRENSMIYFYYISETKSQILFTFIIK